MCVCVAAVCFRTINTFHMNIISNKIMYLNNCSSSGYNLYSYEKFSQVKGITTDKKYERGLKYIFLWHSWTSQKIHAVWLIECTHPKSPQRKTITMCTSHLPHQLYLGYPGSKEKLNKSSERNFLSNSGSMMVLVSFSQNKLVLCMFLVMNMSHWTMVRLTAVF